MERGQENRSKSALIARKNWKGLEWVGKGWNESWWSKWESNALYFQALANTFQNATHYDQQKASKNSLKAHFHLKSK